MRFADPLLFSCTSCGVESALPVRELMALAGCCPNCGASLRDLGLSMRRLADEAATFFDAVMILMHIEERFGIIILDQTVEAICPWNDLTLQDLVAAVQQTDTSVVLSQAEQVVLSAVRTEFPNAPEPLNFNMPLLDAISPYRHERQNI
jgi:predicted RNA-binding Zn-ribbon protein involved in translation (DUF1610 family)